MRRHVLMILACLALTACIGTTVEPPGPNRAGGPRELTDVSARNLGAFNALRAQHGLPALGVDPKLVRIARRHGEDMLQNRFFGHVSSDGRTIVERTRQGGYRFCHVAENLAMGQDSFDAVLRQWMTSPAHRRNVLHRNVDDIGLVRGPGNLWVLVMGRPGC